MIFPASTQRCFIILIVPFEFQHAYRPFHNYPLLLSIHQQVTNGNYETGGMHAEIQSEQSKL